MRLVTALLVVSQCFQAVFSAKILALCGVAAKSHSLWCYKYMSILSERGHQITVLGVDRPTRAIANLTAFIAHEGHEALAAIPNEVWTETIYSKLDTYNLAFKAWDRLSSSAIVRSSALRELVREHRGDERPFDLIIHDNGGAHALLGLVPLFGNPPLVLATTYGAPQWMTSRVGNVFNSAYVPTMITESEQVMDFYERCVNVFYWLFLEWYFDFVIEPYQDRLMREALGSDLPSVRDIAKQASVVIVNHDPAFNGPKPLAPGVIGIAGLHIFDPLPLPQDIQEFMDGAEEGVILLTFGTNEFSIWFSKEFENMIVKTLSRFPQRVLWTTDRDIKNLPTNIMTRKWLPQGDVLAHPKMRLFITHCGLLGTQEAVFREVPILAMPMFLDQMDNAKSMVRKNITVLLDIRTLKEEELFDGVNEILSNPMYKRNIEALGELMRDQPLSAREKAVYWTEYALRHKGAPHLRSAAADMPYYKILLLDVLAVVLAIMLFVCWTLVKLISYVQSFCTFSEPVKGKRD